MKKTIKIFALGLLSAALFSCQDAALPTIDNLVYISDAANGSLGVVNMADPGEDTKVSFTVRLAQAANEDVPSSSCLTCSGVLPCTIFQYFDDTTGIDEMVKYLLTWSNAAVVPPRRALTIPAAGL